MAFRFNPFTGTLDEVSIPVLDNSAAPTMNGNGDLQTAVVNGQGRIYFEANGTRYYIAAVNQGININAGQPIPIGMGLTFTYGYNVN